MISHPPKQMNRAFFLIETGNESKPPKRQNLVKILYIGRTELQKHQSPVTGTVTKAN